MKMKPETLFLVLLLLDSEQKSKWDVFENVFVSECLW